MNVINQPIKRKILIVEDEPIFQDLLVEKFMTKGFEVITAPNGMEGFHMAKQEHPDVIITDLTMPIMDGIDFIKNIREADDWGRGVFIIILSNRGDMNSIADSVDLGAHHYFVKADVEPNKVVEAVTEFFVS